MLVSAASHRLSEAGWLRWLTECHQRSYSVRLRSYLREVVTRIAPEIAAAVPYECVQ